MKYLSFLLVALFLVSCGSHFTMQKRRYNKGFYFVKSQSVNKNNKEKQWREIPKLLFAKSTQPPIHIDSKEHEVTIENVTFLKTSNQNLNQCLQYSSSVKSIKLKKQSFAITHKKNQSSVPLSTTREPKENLTNKIIYIALCFLAGLCFIVGLGTLIVFFSSALNFYLLLTFIWIGLAALFYFITQGMNEN